MKLSEIFIFIIYGTAIFIIFMFVLNKINRIQPRQTVVIYDEIPIYQEPVWSWYGAYNWYPNWISWSGYNQNLHRTLIPYNKGHQIPRNRMHPGRMHPSRVSTSYNKIHAKH